MDRLLAILRPKLEKLARGYADPARAAESTEDVVQEAWLRAWQRLDQFKGGESGRETFAMFQSWMAQLVHRVGLNTKRSWMAQRRSPRQGRILPLKEGNDSSTGRNMGLKSPGTDHIPSAEVLLDEEVHRVQSALDKIPNETDRSIIRLRFFEELSLREISKRLNLSYDKVRERFELGMKLIEDQLGRLSNSE